MAGITEWIQTTCINLNGWIQTTFTVNINNCWNGFITKNYEIAATRRGGPMFLVTFVFGLFFHSMLGAYLVVEASNLRFVVAFTSSHVRAALMMVLGLVCGCILLLDARPLLNAISGYFEEHKDWLVALCVDVFFVILGNLQSLKGNHSKLAASLYECGFIVIGVIMIQIHLSYPRDNTGITIGTIFAVSKILSGFGQLHFNSTTGMEWLLGGMLLFCAIFCKFTEGTVLVGVEEGAQGEIQAGVQDGAQAQGEIQVGVQDGAQGEIQAGVQDGAQGEIQGGEP